MLPDAVPPSLTQLNDVNGASAWARGLRPLDETRAARISAARERARETLLAVDESIRAIVAAVRDRGDLDRTVIMVLSDNGFSFGEHRWVGKGCPFEACVRTPLAMRVPGVPGAVDERLTSNIDVVPTIAELTGTEVRGRVDGLSLVGPGARRRAVLLTYAGDRAVPGWWAVRTRRWKYVIYVDGSRELYDLVADPHEIDNRIGEARLADLEVELGRLLSVLSGGRAVGR